MDAEQAVGAKAQRQHGLITRAQAGKLGISDDVIDWRVKTGAWERVQRGVLRLPGSGFSLCPPSSPGRPGDQGQEGGRSTRRDPGAAAGLRAPRRQRRPAPPGEAPHRGRQAGTSPSAMLRVRNPTLRRHVEVSRRRATPTTSPASNSSATSTTPPSPPSPGTWIEPSGWRPRTGY